MKTHAAFAMNLWKLRYSSYRDAFQEMITNRLKTELESTREMYTFQIIEDSHNLCLMKQKLLLISETTT